MYWLCVLLPIVSLAHQTNSLTCESRADLGISFGNDANVKFDKTCHKTDQCVKVQIEGEAIITKANGEQGTVSGHLAGCSHQEPFNLTCPNHENGCHKLSELSLGTEGQKITGNLSVCCCNTDFCNGPETYKFPRCHEKVEVSHLDDLHDWPSDRPSWCYSPETQCATLQIGEDTQLYRKGSIVERDYFEQFGIEYSTPVQGTIQTCSDQMPWRIDCSNVGVGCLEFKSLRIGLEEARLVGRIKVCCCGTEFCNEVNATSTVMPVVEASTALFTGATLESHPSSTVEPSDGFSETTVTDAETERPLTSVVTRSEDFSETSTASEFETSPMTPEHSEEPVTNMTGTLKCNYKANLQLVNSEEAENVQFDLPCLHADHCVTVIVNGQAFSEPQDVPMDVHMWHTELMAGRQVQGSLSTCSQPSPSDITCETIPNSCKDIEHLAIDGMDLTGNITICCCDTGDFCNEQFEPKQAAKKESESILCDWSHSLQIRAINGSWQDMFTHEASTCITREENHWCASVQVNGDENQLISLQEIPFEIRGEFASCAHPLGFDPMVDCAPFGNGCHNVERLRIGAEGQIVHGNITICCCDTEDLCNGDKTTDVTTTQAVLATTESTEEEDTDLYCYSCMSAVYGKMWRMLELHKIYQEPTVFTDDCNSENFTGASVKCSTYCVTMVNDDWHQGTATQRYGRGCFDSMFAPGMVEESKCACTDNCTTTTAAELFTVVQIDTDSEIHLCTCATSHCNNHSVPLAAPTLGPTVPALQCHSCMSEGYASVWQMASLRYKSPLKFTDQCGNSSALVSMDTVPCDTFCVTLVETVEILGVKRHKYARGCYDSMFHSEPNISEQNHECQFKNSTDLFGIGNVGFDAEIYACSCNSTKCNEQSAPEIEKPEGTVSCYSCLSPVYEDVWDSASIQNMSLSLENPYFSTQCNKMTDLDYLPIIQCDSFCLTLRQEVLIDGFPNISYMRGCCLCNNCTSDIQNLLLGEENWDQQCHEYNQTDFVDIPQGEGHISALACDTDRCNVHK